LFPIFEKFVSLCSVRHSVEGAFDDPLFLPMKVLFLLAGVVLTQRSTAPEATSVVDEPTTPPPRPPPRTTAPPPPVTVVTVVPSAESPGPITVTQLPTAQPATPSSTVPRVLSSIRPTPNSTNTPTNQESGGLPQGAVIGLIIVGAVIICAIVGIFLFRKCSVAPSSGFKNRLKNDASSVTLQQTIQAPTAAVAAPKFATYETTTNEYVYAQTQPQFATYESAYEVPYEPAQATPYQRFPVQAGHQQDQYYQEGYTNQYYDENQYYQEYRPQEFSEEYQAPHQAYYEPADSATHQLPPPNAKS
jgi:hypothetical protein